MTGRMFLLHDFAKLCNKKRGPQIHYSAAVAKIVSTWRRDCHDKNTTEMGRDFRKLLWDFGKSFCDGKMHLCEWATRTTNDKYI